MERGDKSLSSTPMLSDSNGGRKGSGSRSGPIYRQLFTQLLEGLGKHAEGEHLIILQGTPDPDAISAALALEFIGQQFNITSTILCFSGVSHHENRTLVKRLEINLVKYSSEFDLSQYDIYSIVDSQRWQTSLDQRLRDHGVSFFSFIDHHREEAIPPPAEFVDVRPHISSTAAICCDYLMQMMPHGLSPSDPSHVRLATALMHGIRSDTSRFILATQSEYDAAAFLSPCVDTNVIEIIERKVLTPAMLDMFESALVNRRIHDNFIVSDVGFVRSADRDGIPQVTELLLAREGTDTVLVFGIVDERIIDGSLRTRSETINPDEFLKGVLGASPESGRYYGGGNIRDRGGFQIPLGFFSLHEDKKQIYSIVRQVIEKAFLEHIGRTTTALKALASAE